MYKVNISKVTDKTDHTLNKLNRAEALLLHEQPI